MSNSNPLFLASFFTSSELNNIKQKIKVIYPWDEDYIKIEVVCLNKNTETETETVCGTSDSSNKNSTLMINKATGIPPHVMILANMKKVIDSQKHLLDKMINVIVDEFDKREVGHATFKVQKQVEDLIASFESNVLNKFDSLHVPQSKKSI